MRLIAVLALLGAAAPLGAAELDPRHPRFLLRGMVTLDGATATFRTCGEKGRDYTVVDASSDASLSAAYRELAAQPGAPVFMALRGAVLAAPAGARIERELHVEAVERAEKQGPGCRRALGRIEALALGGTPAWQIELSPAGVTYASLDERGTLVFPPVGTAWDADGALRYEGRTETATLSLALEPGRCRDTATGNWYPLSAQVVLNGTAYRGCAFRAYGRAAPAASPGSTGASTR